MTGRTPADAFRAFITPFESAIACLGTAKIVVSPGGKAPGRVHSWALNGVSGMGLPGGRHFEAQMHYEFMQIESGWRITTRGYRYKFQVAGIEVFRMDWHPTGPSPFRQPHLHLNKAGPSVEAIDHLPTPRMTFEDAVEWVIRYGAPPAKADYESILEETRSAHIAHRSWHDVGPTTST